MITAQQVCALAALTVIKHRLEGKNPIGEADLEWIFARNCEALNSYEERIIQTEKVCADLSSLRKVLGSALLFFFETGNSGE